MVAPSLIVWPVTRTRWSYRCCRCGKEGRATSNGHESQKELEAKALLNGAQHLKRCKSKGN